MSEQAASAGPRAWARGYIRRGPGPLPRTQTATYRLADLVNRGLIAPAEGRGLLMKAGLRDFAWQVMWGEDYDNPDSELEARIGGPQGYVIFIHGWTGSHRIWEELPAWVVARNRRLVALIPDHNGFGGSGFVDPSPGLDYCSPPAAMQVLDAWIKILRIRRQPGETAFRVINLVGHSMGGAMLFYLNPALWSFGEETRYALAPALLLYDTEKKSFYTSLGLGIGLVNRVKALTPIERALKPAMIETLCGGASDFVKLQHIEQYDRAPRGTTAATLTAMGLLDNAEIARKWDLFRVMLGHKDPLVGLLPMMDLLTDLEFPPGNLRVVPGTHYMFSVGKDMAFQHAQNRDLVVQDILDLHERAYGLQKTGRTVG